jgi:1-acyl-sn-glycerol-3-phosphate acyltransferase
MALRLPPPLRGAIAFTLLVLNTVFWCTPLFALALVKLLMPSRRERLDPLLNEMAHRWIACNSGWMALTQDTRWDVDGLDGLRPDGWTLVNSNHQSWVDIFVLQHLLNRRLPLLKFFLKQQLIWVPVIGLAWWALDFPFMRRHSKAQLRKHPELRQQDRETARRACEKFALVPTSVMNFAEGTRFTEAKRAGTSSPYRHLLKPKAGAIAMALDAMGPQFDSLLDVTIVYPGGAPSFWQFLCGRVPEIVVRARALPIPDSLCEGDYDQDAAFRSRLHTWLAELWSDKDELIGSLLQGRVRPPGAAAPG